MKGKDAPVDLVVEVLREVVSRGGAGKARAKFQKLPVGWRKAVLAGLKAAQADDLSALLVPPVAK